MSIEFISIFCAIAAPFWIYYAWRSIQRCLICGDRLKIHEQKFCFLCWATLLRREVDLEFPSFDEDAPPQTPNTKEKD